MSRFLPVILMVLGLGTLSLMDALVKILGDGYPVWQITFLRYFFGVLVILPLVAITRPSKPTWPVVRANMSRGIILLIAAVCFFNAIQYLPLALATSLFFTAPLITVILGLLFLGEPVNGRDLSAIATGLVGVAIICGGSLTAEQFSGDITEMAIGFALGLTTAVFYSIGVVMIRARAQRDQKVTIVVLQSLASTTAAAPFGLTVWTPIEGGDWSLFLMLGVCGTAGFLAISHALARAPVAKLMPLEYTAFLWASLWGYLFFAEMPRSTTIAGAVLIVIAGMIVLKRHEPVPALAAKDADPV